MKTLHSVLALGVAATCLSFPAQAAKPAAAPPAAASSSIDIWIRGGGPLQGDNAPRGRAQSVNLDTLPLVDSQRFDAQYGASHAFRGIALANVIASFAPIRLSTSRSCTSPTGWRSRSRSATPP